MCPWLWVKPGKGEVCNWNPKIFHVLNIIRRPPADLKSPPSPQWGRAAVVGCIYLVQDNRGCTSTAAGGGLLARCLCVFLERPWSVADLFLWDWPPNSALTSASCHTQHLRREEIMILCGFLDCSTVWFLSQKKETDLIPRWLIDPVTGGDRTLQQFHITITFYYKPLFNVDWQHNWPMAHHFTC